MRRRWGQQGHTVLGLPADTADCRTGGGGGGGSYTRQRARWPAASGVALASPLLLPTPTTSSDLEKNESRRFI